ncbi:MAG: nucleotidyltransferase family protein [Verrucomicrobiales bacterium]|nr:nucleotidyltransferase family protein [Verrucomicrobiales bacterium]
MKAAGRQMCKTIRALTPAAGFGSKVGMAQIHGHLGVVILGAGASARMGRPKLLLPWRGTTVAGHLLAQWRETGAGQIAVVLRSNDTALAAELDRLNVPKPDRIENPQPERGMFSSIVCAANWHGWRREISSWAIVLGDQPHLRPETLRQLLEFSVQNKDAICQPAFGGRLGHPVILPRQTFMELKNSAAATLKDFLKPAAAPRVQCSVADAGLSLDLDTPEDYKRLTNSHQSV